MYEKNYTGVDFVIKKPYRKFLNLRAPHFAPASFKILTFRALTRT